MQAGKFQTDMFSEVKGLQRKKSLKYISCATKTP